MGQPLVLVGTAPLSLPTRVISVDHPCVLGRSSHCDVVVDHPSVSRRHAAIEVCGHAIRVTDLGSTNGTFVDGERIAHAKVDPGQQVRFGGVNFIVSIAGEGAEDVDSSLDTDGTPASNGRHAAELASDRLSEAQRRVFDLMIGGITEKRIAGRLGVSRHTVHNHVRAIYVAFGVHSRPELLASVMRWRGIRPDLHVKK